MAKWKITDFDTPEKINKELGRLKNMMKKDLPSMYLESIHKSIEKLEAKKLKKVNENLIGGVSMNKTKTLNEEYEIYLKESRLPKTDGVDPEFGIPEEKKFPLFDANHVKSAVKFFNYAKPEYRKNLANKIKRKMKQYNISFDIVGDSNEFKKYIGNSKKSMVTEQYNKLQESINNISDVEVRTSYKNKLKSIMEASTAVKKAAEANDKFNNGDMSKGHSSDKLINGKLTAQSIAMKKQRKKPTDSDKNKVIERTFTKMNKVTNKKLEDKTKNVTGNMSEATDPFLELPENNDYQAITYDIIKQYPELNKDGQLDVSAMLKSLDTITESMSLDKKRQLLNLIRYKRCK